MLKIFWESSFFRESPCQVSKQLRKFRSALFLGKQTPKLRIRESSHIQLNIPRAQTLLESLGRGNPACRSAIPQIFLCLWPSPIPYPKQEQS